MGKELEKRWMRRGEKRKKNKKDGGNGDNEESDNVRMISEMEGKEINLKDEMVKKEYREEVN